MDADGKLVKAGPVLTLKANRLGGKAHNPYLQHIKVRASWHVCSVLRRFLKSELRERDLVRHGRDYGG